MLSVFLDTLVICTATAFMCLSTGIDLAAKRQGLIVIVNVPAILILGNQAVKCLEDYTAQKNSGKDPHFAAKSIGITGKTDFWQDE